MRDLSIFKVPPKPSTTAIASRRWREQCAELAHQLDLPPVIARHAVNKGASKTRVREIAATFFAGCCMTGRAFTDKLDARSPDPHAAVIRKDGSMVTYAVWVLSQEGAISDQMLKSAAAAIVQHAQRVVPHVGSTPTAARAPQPPQPQPAQEPTDALTALTDLGSEHDHHDDSYDAYGGHTAESAGASALVWDDDRQAVVRVAV